MRAWGVAVALGAVTLTACSSNLARESGPPSTAPVPTSAATTPPAPPRPDHAVTIAFGGDVHFEGSSAQALSDGMSAIAPTLRAADLAMVNLETAITTRGTAQQKDFVFRAPPSAFTALRAAGVDVVTEANNHGMDYGIVGLRDSIAAAKAAHFPAVGIGLDEAAAFKPWRTTIHGQRIAVIGATQVIDSNLMSSWTAGPDHAGLASAYDEATLLSTVGAARRTADIVIVYLHWGTERMNCPNGRQRDLAPQIADAGADVVVGSHAHVQLGGGYLHHTYVDYGLGNFVFYAHGNPATTRSGVLTLTVHRHAVTKATWSPAVIESGVPVPLHEDAAAAARKTWLQLRDCTGLAATAR